MKCPKYQTPKGQLELPHEARRCSRCGLKKGEHPALGSTGRKGRAVFPLGISR